MQTYISLLRGINVGGHRMIKMDTLQELLKKLGMRDVSTYIQSGNLVYRSKETDIQKLNLMLKKGIENEFGFEVPVITFTSAEWSAIIQDNPFTRDNTKNPAYMHLTLLSDIPLDENVGKICKKDYPDEDFFIAGKAVYLYCPDGYSNTKLNNTLLEKKLKISATTRNWKTAIALAELAGNI